LIRREEKRKNSPENLADSGSFGTSRRTHNVKTRCEKSNSEEEILPQLKYHFEQVKKVSLEIIPKILL